MDLTKAIDKVAEILKTSDIKEIRIKDGGSCIFMTKNSNVNVVSAPTVSAVTPTVNATTETTSSVAPSTPDPVTGVAPQDTVDGEEIKSPMVGTFYSSASPDAPAYVKDGQEVKKGDVLCIIEAMKIMNKIEAEKSGTISKILVKDGESVQFDQPLFIIS